MRPANRILLASSLLVSLPWLGWLALRITIEPGEYASLSEIPALTGCLGVIGSGPVRTLHYRHPHDTERQGNLWITGVWLEEAFSRFAAANALSTDLVAADWMNDQMQHLPPDFAQGMRFDSNDLAVAGQLCRGPGGVKGSLSRRSGRFVLLVTPSG